MGGGGDSALESRGSPPSTKFERLALRYARFDLWIVSFLVTSFSQLRPSALVASLSLISHQQELSILTKDLRVPNIRNAYIVSNLCERFRSG